MEQIIVSEWMETSFFVNLVEKTYGVYINIADIDKADEIIRKFRDERKELIEAWKKEWGYC